jgi:methionine synthase II (cobalamin-independent)
MTSSKSNKLKLTLETINTPKGKIPTASGIHNILEAMIEYFKVETATSIQTLRDTLLQQIGALVKHEVENLTSEVLETIQTDLTSFRELFTEQSTSIELLERALNEIKMQLNSTYSSNTDAFSGLLEKMKELEDSVEILDLKFKNFASKLAETLRTITGIQKD